MMVSKRFALLLAPLLLVACADEGDDLRAWMAHEARGMVDRIEPLPDLKTFPTVSYSQGEEVDPFRASRIAPEARARMGQGPDMARPREPLEGFPLESLSMVGTLMQEERKHALIRVDGRIHQVAAGNYMGQDHGMITQVTEGAILLTEIVEDINGDWTERSSRLLLQER
jgi:type IV pilus assembly protein PilP